MEEVRSLYSLIALNYGHCSKLDAIYLVLVFQLGWNGFMPPVNQKHCKSFTGKSEVDVVYLNWQVLQCFVPNALMPFEALFCHFLFKTFTAAAYSCKFKFVVIVEHQLFRLPSYFLLYRYFFTFYNFLLLLLLKLDFSFSLPTIPLSKFFKKCDLNLFFFKKIIIQQKVI